MKLNLNGVEIELPNNAKVDVSKDGKHVKIELPEQKEKIRIVEVPGETERIVERIKIVEVEKPCTRPHYYPSYPTYPTCPPTYPNQPWITWTAGDIQYTNTSGYTTTGTADNWTVTTTN
jgi:hypothetical protein